MTRSDVSRRDFIAAGALATPLLLTAPAWLAAAPSRTLNIGCIGVGGKGASDMAEMSRQHRIAAICDVDAQRLEGAAQKHPQAARFSDWRRLLEHPGLDGVTVSTPDHTHAPATLAAIERGLHVYTQKPLTRTVAESRQLAAAAARQGIVSQMGIQHHSSSRLQAAVELIRSGVIGKVREAHAWTDRPGTFWKQGLDRPERRDTPPAHLDWKLWLGAAPQRPYVAGLYHPFHWRAWWDFGTGALGDMGCHLLDPVVDALQLGPPAAVRAEGPPPHPESGPLWCIVRYEFPATPYTAADGVQVVWYEAGKQPPRDIFLAPKDWPGSANGVLFRGAKGNLFVGFPEPPELFPKGDFSDTKIPQPPERNHYQQWTDAILGEGPTTCGFQYSGPLSETVLLGNVAYRSGQPVAWDSEKLSTGSAAGDALVKNG